MLFCLLLVLNHKQKLPYSFLNFLTEALCNHGGDELQVMDLTHQEKDSINLFDGI